MDRHMSRSVPYLPRYQSCSPARSPHLGRRKYTSLRSVSQPTQRIFYIDNTPNRVIGSHHHSPSPHRSYKVHVFSSKTNGPLTRTSRSLSHNDIYASHVYTSAEDISNSKSLREAASRNVGSCDDLYHKAPFFPDLTPSESGVSVGGSEEGSFFGAEDDNISQNSFGSSSAFYEATMDSELDSMSGPEGAHFGDRALDVLYEDDLDEKSGGRSSRGRRGDVCSPDSNRSSPLTYGDMRKRELMSSPSWDFDKTQARFQALKVLIPGAETGSAKAGKDQGKLGDKKVLSSTPLAQSTPHVSPRGFGETKLSVKASWNVDDPDDELGRLEKSKAARALFDMELSENEGRSTSRFEDSSFNSNSEDNMSDVSNCTMASIPTTRKTKLVKKASDKPASARKVTAEQGPSNMDQKDSRTGLVKNADASHLYNIYTASGDVGLDSPATSRRANVDSLQEQQTLSKSSTRDEHDGARLSGSEWWAVYNIGTAQERGRTDGKVDSEEENVSNYSREIRVVKPVKVNIPLISAGKHGQEKLRRRSQTSPPFTQSPPKSPSASSPVRLDEKQREEPITDHSNANTSRFEGASQRERSELMKFDVSEYHDHQENNQEEEEKQSGRVFGLVHNLEASTAETNERTQSVEGKCDKNEGVNSTRAGVVLKSERDRGKIDVNDESSRIETEEVFGLTTGDTEIVNVHESGYIKGEKLDGYEENGGSKGSVDNLPSHLPSAGSLHVTAVEEDNNYQAIDGAPLISCPTTDLREIGRTLTGPSPDEVSPGPSSTDTSASHKTDRAAEREGSQVGKDEGNDRAHASNHHYKLGNGDGGEGEEIKLPHDQKSASLPAEEEKKKSAQVAGKGGENSSNSVSTASFASGKLQPETGVGECEQRSISSIRKIAEQEVNNGQDLNESESLSVTGETRDGVKSDSVVATTRDVEENSEGIEFNNSVKSNLKSDNSRNDVDSLVATETYVEIRTSDALDPELIEENNTHMEKFIDPRMSGLLGRESGEPPQMVVSVVATAQRFDDTCGDTTQRPRSAFSSPQRRSKATANTGPDTQQQQQSLPSAFQCDVSFARVNTSAFDSPAAVTENYISDSNNFNKSETQSFSRYNQQVDSFSSGSSDSANLRQAGSSSASHRTIRDSEHGQQETRSGFSGEDSEPVVDESIKQPSGARHGNKGICQGENRSPLRDCGRYVDRGEEFLHHPSPLTGNQATITEVSKHIHRTTIEKIVTTERVVKPSTPGDSSYSSDSVDVISGKSTTETLYKEDDDYFKTTTTTSTSTSVIPGVYSSCEDTRRVVSSDTGALIHHQPPVSSDNDFVDINSGDTRDSHLSASHLSTVAPAHAHLSTPSSSSALGLTSQPEDSDEMRGKKKKSKKGETISTTSATPDPSVTSVTAMKGRDVLTWGHDTSSRSVTHHKSPLDNLQAQLSSISGDLSPVGKSDALNKQNNSTSFHDHAEATSVLKNIVRGDTSDFTNFSNKIPGVHDSDNDSDSAYYSYNVTTGSIRRHTGECVDTVDGTCDDSNGGVVRVEREVYDNDYDYVTTDLPKGTFSSHHSTRPHIQLLKPGQLKASSLWTLQEETESLVDATSPKPTPKRTLASVGSEEENISDQSSPPRQSPNKTEFDDHWASDDNETIKFSRGLNSDSRQRPFASESSDFDDSDGNYSSISTAESTSYRSSSYGREQTPLSETDSSPPRALGPDKMDYSEAEDLSQSPNADRISTFREFVTGLEDSDFTSEWANNSQASREGNQANSSIDLGTLNAASSPAINTSKSSVAFSVTSPERENAMSILDSLTASLEQFTTPDTSVNEDFFHTSSPRTEDDSRSLPLTKSTLSAFNASTQRGGDMLKTSNVSTHHNWNDDTASEASSRLHALDLDLSRISSCNSPTPSDFSEASMYTCTGTAEVRRPTVTFDYDIPSATASTPIPMNKGKLKSALKRPAPSTQDTKHVIHEQKFEKLLKDFNKSTCPKESVPELIFLEETRPDATQSSTTTTTNYDDLYKTFTNDDSEKKQNHTCVVVEDENMSTFRFKRFLKKSHTKRKKGRRVLRFLSKLSCVSETVQSPEGSPIKVRVKEQDGHIFSTDSMPSSGRQRISNPILISSTSFQHHPEFINSPNTSPQKSPTHVGSGNSPSSSNQSLDSFRSRTDSAYSSISESTAMSAGPLGSPKFFHNQQRLSVTTSTPRVPVTSSGSVSSVFQSGDRSFSDSAYSTSSDMTSRTFSEADFTHSPLPTGGKDMEMLSALSDVFEQLDVCEGEIDTALLNRLRHGHTQASK